MSNKEAESPFWEPPEFEEKELAEQQEHLRKEYLLLDPQYPGETSRYMMEPTYKTRRWFWILFVITGGMVTMMMGTWLYQMIYGLGITGLNRPVMWALYIVNFVYFIGIGHAGTFISAAFRVLKVEWRRPITRMAELITVFGLMTAALFPIIHIGRTWKGYWLLPYPNERQLWPSFHSPLLWDLTAITTYLTCSILFMYMGLIPDLANFRDHSTGWRHKIYEWFALGWIGTERQWSIQETALNIFSYAIIPVMFSVHTIVSWDFAMALQPTWHSTIFGPYFVVGALFSGAAAVIIAMILLRKALNLKYFLRAEQFNGMAMFLLLLSLTWDYFYFNDYIVPWYGNEPIEKVISTMLQGGFGGGIWYLMIFSNTILPALTLWSRKIRTNLPILFTVCVFVNIGMYIERYIIIPTGLGRNWLPYSWGLYIPHVPESLITVGAFMLVAFLYILFTRIFPVVPLWEVYEGQLVHSVKRIGKAIVRTKIEMH